MESGGTMQLRCFQSVYLPTGPFGTSLKNPVEVIRSMLRGWIWPDMTCPETILNGQQIHTSPSISNMILSISSMLVDGREADCSLRAD